MVKSVTISGNLKGYNFNDNSESDREEDDSEEYFYDIDKSTYQSEYFFKGNDIKISYIRLKIIVLKRSRENIIYLNNKKYLEIKILCQDELTYQSLEDLFYENGIKQTNYEPNNYLFMGSTRKLPCYKKQDGVINEFLTWLEKTEPLDRVTSNSMREGLSYHFGPKVYPEQIAYDELRQKALEDPKNILEAARNLNLCGFNRSFFLVAEVLEAMYPEIALEATYKVWPTDPDFIEAKYIQANILMCYKGDLLGAFFALNDVNSEQIIELRTKIFECLVGTGFDNIAPCKIDISANTILKLGEEIANLKKELSLENETIVIKKRKYLS